MIRSVARVYAWASPKVIESLFLDDEDIHGLVYWYNDARDQEEEIKQSTKTGK